MTRKEPEERNIHRFSLGVTKADDLEIINEFKSYCKSKKKKYSQVAITLFKEYLDMEKALR